MVNQFGHYELIAQLGGRDSHVFQAHDPRIGRMVALKVLPPDADGERRERLLAEARIATRLRHPGLVEVLDVAEENGQLFLVMELLAGRTLRAALPDLTNQADRIWVARQLAEALCFIHQHNVVHRDVKPDNIFLERDGHLKLLDFGFAKVQGLHLTGAGFTLGTPYYMAPEQVRGERITPLVDIYAYGVTCYEMFTQRRLVSGDRIDEVFDAILNNSVELDALEHCGAPPSVVDMVRWCTAKAPNERPQSFEDVLRLLPELAH